MDQYILVRFKSSEEQTAIIAAFLMDIGFDGIEESDTGSVACIKAISFDKEATEAIFRQFNTDFETELVAQQNWNALWEQSFEPVIVDDFVAIRASFHKPVRNVQHELIITPKMSFGTGHHATTYLVMQLMRNINFIGKTVIDFGTGTGVLAILAEKLGAENILGIDNDDWSINNALENIESNDCHHVRLVKADAMVEQEKADVILANINLNVILANLSALKTACNAGAIIVFSGLMTQDEEQIRHHLTIHQFQVLQLVTKSNWIAIKTQLI